MADEADRPLAQVTIISSDSIQPEATAHIKSWEMPAEFVGLVEAWLTAMLGPPTESLCSVGSAIEVAKMSEHVWVSGGEDDGG